MYKLNNNTKAFRNVFAKQIQLDKEHGDLDSTNFGKSKKNLTNWIKYIKAQDIKHENMPSESIEFNLNIEDGITYRQDIRDKNHSLFDKDDNNKLIISDKNKKVIKAQKSHYKTKCIYPVANDINSYPAPLTHKKLWNMLNRNNAKLSNQSKIMFADTTAE